MINPVSYIAAMSPYTLADLTPPVGKRLISLSQNESLRPPSPQVANAVASAMAEAQLYPDPDWRGLRTTLADLHGIPAEGILCGNGSMELITALAQGFANEQKAILAPIHAYPFFRTASQLAQARFDTAHEEDGRVAVDALLSAVRPDTSLVFLANPGNPTGTRIPRAELVRLRETLPGDVLLVIDEAYGEFADHLAEPMFDLVGRGDTVVLRTLSKAYGLAGMRLGWGVFPPDIGREMRKIMTPNSISVAGQAAAMAALSDQAYMHETCHITKTLRDGFIDRLRRAGFDVPNSFTNFALIRLENSETARCIDEALRREGVFLRAQTGAGLPHCLRVTIGDAERLDFTATLLERWVERGTL